MLLLNKLKRSKAFRSSNGGGLRGIFPIVNSFASNCCHSSADSSLLGVNNFSEAGLELVAAADAEVTGCPEAPALWPDKALLEGEAEEATVAPKAPKAAGVVLAEFPAEALPKPKKPEVPKPPAVAAALKEKEAADGAAELPKPMDCGALGEDVVPNAGGFAAAADLPSAARLLPHDVELVRLELVLKEKLLALVLLLLTGKPASREFTKNIRIVSPRILNNCCISRMQQQTTENV